MKNENAYFGHVLHAYTRKDALSDGIQIDVTQTAKEAGLCFPTFLTRTVYEAFVVVPPGVEGQDEAGRLWDILWMLRFAIKQSASSTDRLTFQLRVRNNTRSAKLVELIAICGPLDIDKNEPAITVMLPEDD